MTHNIRITASALLAPALCAAIGLGLTFGAVRGADTWATGRRVDRLRAELAPAAAVLQDRLDQIDAALAGVGHQAGWPPPSWAPTDVHDLAGVAYVPTTELARAGLADELGGEHADDHPDDGLAQPVHVDLAAVAGALQLPEPGPRTALARPVSGPDGEHAGWALAVLQPTLADELAGAAGVWVAVVADGTDVASSAGANARLLRAASAPLGDRPGWRVEALVTPSYLADPLPVTTAGVGATATLFLAAGVGVWSLQSRRRRLVESQLADTYRESRYDALTGIANRVHLMEWLDNQLERCRQGGTEMGLMFIDVDRFKTVNDTMGHAVGDELLCEVARRLAGSVRSGDLVARLAGDEFVIAFPTVASPAKLGELAERVVAAFEPPVELSTGPFYASLSIGLAMCAGEVSDLHTLLAQADAAMYVAKGTPGSHYAFFDEALRAEADNRHAIGEALRAGIEADELTLYYQPAVAVPSGEVVAVEAFIRWNRPGIGVLTPGSFLDVAEETGLIAPLGRWVVSQACAQARQWNPAGREHAPIPVAINVSERELLTPGFVGFVQAALEETHLAPALLHIEITEAVALDKRVISAGVLEELRLVGVGLVIDDFGSRHGSLSLLRQLGVAMVKIHGSTATAVMEDSASQAVVGAVVGLARVLGAKVVAESVETPAQLQALLGLGVRYMQGHLLLPPVPAPELGPIAEHRQLGAVGGLGLLAAAADLAPVGGALRLARVADDGAGAAHTSQECGCGDAHRCGLCGRGANGANLQGRGLSAVDARLVDGWAAPARAAAARPRTLSLRRPVWRGRRAQRAA